MLYYCRLDSEVYKNVTFFSNAIKKWTPNFNGQCQFKRESDSATYVPGEVF